MHKIRKERPRRENFTAFAFRTRRGFPNSSSGAVVDWTGTQYEMGSKGENIVELSMARNSVYAASEVEGVRDKFDENHPTSVYIHGTENYDGLRRIYNTRAGRSVQIYAPYVPEAPSYSLRCGYRAEVPCELGGFSYHSDLTRRFIGIISITIYSAKGSAFDNTIYYKNLLSRTVGVPNIEHWFTPPRLLAPGDRVDLTAASGTLGILLYIRKL